MTFSRNLRTSRMLPLYLIVVLLLSAFIPPSLGQGYGLAPAKGKKHRTTTTTTLPPDIASLNLGQEYYQPGYNPISSTPVPDNSLGSYNPPPQGGSGSYWWQNPDSPFIGATAPAPSPSPQPGFPDSQPGHPGAQPGSQPGYPGSQPGQPGLQPGYPGSQPGSQPGYPGSQPGSQPGYPGSQPGLQPGYPGSQPGLQPGYPGSQPGQPGSQPGYPGSQPGQPGGCGGGVAGGCGGTQAPINIQGNPFLSGLKPGSGSQQPPIQPTGQTITCSGSGYVCAPKHLCRNGIVTQDGQGIFQVRSQTQYCDAATQACCRLPSEGSVPSGGCGAGGGCSGVQPAPGAPQPSPFPSQPPSSGFNNAGPGLVHIPPTPRPSHPPGQQYPSASIPSPTYAPTGNNLGQPVPGTNGIPIGGSIYDTTGRPVTQNPDQHPYTGPLNTTPHPGCAAALKCVQESYCTAEGVMSDRPVSLTREEYENRVPLSDCADPDTGVLGKCCRDPNYKDPWPGGMMGKNNDGSDGSQLLPQHQIHPQPQSNECGPSASCQPTYQCGNQYRVQPLRNCRVPLDGSSGVCCSSTQPEGEVIPGSTPVPQKPQKKPIPGYPQPKPSAQPFPQKPSSQPFPQQPFSQTSPSVQPFPQTSPSQQSFPQTSPSKQPFPQTSPSQQPFPHTSPSQQPFPQTSPSQQPFSQPSPSQQPFPQPSPSKQPFPQPSKEPFPQSSPSQQSYPHISPSQQPFPQISPSQQPFPQSNPSQQSYPHTSAQQPFSQTSPSQQPFPQPNPSKQPFPQPSKQPFPQTNPSQQPYPQTSPSQQPFPQPSPSKQPFPQPSKQPFPQTNPSQQPYPQTSPSQQPFPQPSPSKQPFPQPFKEPFSQTSPSQQPYPHTSPSQKPFPQTSPSQQPFPQTSPSQQPFTHTSPSQQQFSQASPSQQPFPQISPSQQPFPQSSPSQQSFPQTSPTQHSVPSPQPSPHPFPQPKPSVQPFPSQPLQPFPTALPTQPVPNIESSPYPKPVPGYQTQTQQPFPSSSPGFPIQSQFPGVKPGQSGQLSPKPGAECGIRRQVSRQGLADTDAGFSEFPWQALVLSSSQEPLCSAAIISDRAVVTAAHCLESLESSDLIVQAGIWKLSSNNQPKPIQTQHVAAVARHPNYDPSSLFNDLAVVVLSAPLKFDDHVDKICLPPKGQDVSRLQRVCIATGWGKSAIKGNAPGSILHQIPVTLIPHTACEEKLRQTHLGRYFILNPSFQCAIPTGPSQDFCKVDAGGPVACDRGDGHHELSGTYSWDIGCNVSDSPTVFGGVDTDWIEKVLARPIDDLERDELNDILKQQQQQKPELIGVDIDNKPGFSQGYGRK